MKSRRELMAGIGLASAAVAAATVPVLAESKAALGNVEFMADEAFKDWAFENRSMLEWLKEDKRADFMGLVQRTHRASVAANLA